MIFDASNCIELSGTLWNFSKSIYLLLDLIVEQDSNKNAPWIAIEFEKVSKQKLWRACVACCRCVACKLPNVSTHTHNAH